jgi:hypothetical protein
MLIAPHVRKEGSFRTIAPALPLYICSMTLVRGQGELPSLSRFLALKGSAICTRRSTSRPSFARTHPRCGTLLRRVRFRMGGGDRGNAPVPRQLLFHVWVPYTSPAALIMGRYRYRNHVPNNPVTGLNFSGARLSTVPGLVPIHLQLDEVGNHAISVEMRVPRHWSVACPRPEPHLHAGHRHAPARCRWYR